MPEYSISQLDRFEAATEYEPHESPLCDWCPYWDLCPVKKHLVKVEALPKDKWKDEPGGRHRGRLCGEVEEEEEGARGGKQGRRRARQNPKEGP